MAERLDAAYRATAADLAANAAVRIEAETNGIAALSLAALDKQEELTGLVALRTAVGARMPRLDLPPRRCHGPAYVLVSGGRLPASRTRPMCLTGSGRWSRPT